MEYTKENVKKQVEESLSKIRKMTSMETTIIPPPESNNIVYWIIAIGSMVLLNSFIRR